jgi:hypothetical protein
VGNDTVSGNDTVCVATSRMADTGQTSEIRPIVALGLGQPVGKRHGIRERHGSREDDKVSGAPTRVPERMVAVVGVGLDWRNVFGGRTGHRLEFRPDAHCMAGAHAVASTGSSRAKKPLWLAEYPASQPCPGCGLTPRRGTRPIMGIDLMRALYPGADPARPIRCLVIGSASSRYCPSIFKRSSGANILRAADGRCSKPWCL